MRFGTLRRLQCRFDIAAVVLCEISQTPEAATSVRSGTAGHGSVWDFASLEDVVVSYIRVSLVWEFYHE